ncbi:hypothetical protein LINGRAPRIM_LOCUS2256 [Linum grandiflorum]
MDSATTLSIFLVSEEPLHQHPNLVLQFCCLLLLDGVVSLSHIYREGNFLADCLGYRGFTILFRIHNMFVDDSEII